MSAPRTILKALGIRLWMRWFVLRAGMTALLFWTVFVIGAVWLQSRGLGWVALALFFVWLYLVLPSVLTQAQLINDLFAYLLTGKTLYFKSLLSPPEATGEHPAVRTLTPRQRRVVAVLRRLMSLVRHTSPFSALAQWSLLVLVRMPAGAHFEETIPEARSEVRRAQHHYRRIQRRAEGEYIERTLVHSH